MSFIYENMSLIDSDENALLDSDFSTIHTQHQNHVYLNLLSESSEPSEQLFRAMGKSGKRKHSLTSSHDSSLTTNSTDIDDDSGFCGSHLSHKMVRFDDEMLLLKALMKEVNEVNEPLVESSNRNNTINAINNTNKVANYQSKSKNGKYWLEIVKQPEEQHRARYLTEGSRGAIKDKNGLSHPIVKVTGYNKGPVKVQCFIGHDKQIGSSHLFYQASKITGKNSTRCITKKIDGTTVIIMEAAPENDMLVTVDCVGILKERNVDVEQKLTRFKNKADSEGATVPTKKRSTRCRLVFRAQIPDTNEILQVVSSPILCTQPLGTPEICKKSVSQCNAKGGEELFIIGKNFLKDAKIIWKNANWSKTVEPDKEFLHSTHMICLIPCYDGPDLKTQNSVEVSLTIKSGGKYSDPHKFTFINCEKVNTMTLINGTALNGTTTSGQLLVSNFEKPIVLTMIGSAALSNTINSIESTEMVNISNTINSIESTQMVNKFINDNDLQSNITSLQTNDFNALTADTICYSNANSNQGCVLSVIDDETTQIDSNLLNEMQNNLSQTFNTISEISFDKTSQDSDKNTVNINENDFKSESLIINSNTSETTSESVSLPLPEEQYLPLTSFETMPSNNSIILNTTLEPAVSSSPMTVVPQIPIESDPISNLLEQIPDTQLLPTPMPVINPEPTLPLIDSISSAIQPKTESIPIKSINSENSVLAPTMTSTPVTQASNISALSEMTDAELLCFINPAAFDQM